MSTGILPINMRLSAESAEATHHGETTHGEFMVQRALPASQIVATLDGDASVFQLREIVATEQILERLSDEEFEQLPRALRTEENRFGLRFVEFSRAGNQEPLAVQPGLMVRGIVDCTAPPDLPPTTHTAALRIDGLGEGSELPITFVTAGVQVEFPKGPVIARKGQSVSIPVRVTLPGAPATDLTLEISHGFAEIRPTPIHVPIGGSATADLTLRTAPQTPLGKLASTLTVKGHSQNFHMIPIEILVREPVQTPQLNKASVIAEIHDTYLKTGGPAGRLGFPISEVDFVGNTAKRRYRGGEIRARAEFDGANQIGVTTQAFAIPGLRITFIGFQCLVKSLGGGKDEPYFILSVSNGDNQTRVQMFGPFENVGNGTEIGVGSILLGSGPPNPTAILAVAFENDEGDPDETARKIREKAAQGVQQLQSVIASAAASSPSGPGISSEDAASSVAGIITGPFKEVLPAAVVSLLGLDDDYIGQDVALVLQRPEEVGTKPPIGEFRGKPFNEKIEISGGDEGFYALFFDVFVDSSVMEPILF
jgi:hypothetical protein